MIALRETIAKEFQFFHQTFFAAFDAGAPI